MKTQKNLKSELKTTFKVCYNCKDGDRNRLNFVFASSEEEACDSVQEQEDWDGDWEGVSAIEE